MNKIKELTRFNMLRQQKFSGEHSLCLSDFIAPQKTGIGDYIGAFAVTAGIGASELAGKYEASEDDYNAIMVKALADRLAEAFAERLHQEARAEWGFADDTEITNEDLNKEKYRGIRPAFGYPACPDHSEKEKLFDIFDHNLSGSFRHVLSCSKPKHLLFVLEWIALHHGKFCIRVVFL